MVTLDFEKMIESRKSFPYYIGWMTNEPSVDENPSQRKQIIRFTVAIERHLNQRDFIPKIFIQSYDRRT